MYYLYVIYTLIHLFLLTLIFLIKVFNLDLIVFNILIYSYYVLQRDRSLKNLLLIYKVVNLSIFLKVIILKDHLMLYLIIFKSLHLKFSFNLILQFLGLY